MSISLGGKSQHVQPKRLLHSFVSGVAPSCYPANLSPVSEGHCTGSILLTENSRLPPIRRDHFAGRTKSKRSRNLPRQAVPPRTECSSAALRKPDFPNACRRVSTLTIDAGRPGDRRRKVDVMICSTLSWSRAM